MVKLRDALMIGVSILILGIVLSVGIDIDTAIGEETTSKGVTNETVTFTNNTYSKLANMPIAGVSLLMNYTQILQPVYNWNWTKYDGVIINAYGGNDTLVWNVSYSHWNTSEYQTADEASKGALEFASWSDTIALVSAAAIIIGILTGIFALKSRGGI